MERKRERTATRAAFRAQRPRLGEAAAACSELLAEAVAETIWPTRCAVCDAPGEVLCSGCRSALPFIDYWRACPRCGAPYGDVQCTECTTVLLEAAGLTEPPFDAAASAVVLDEAARRAATVYKDQGEQRLAEPLAQMTACYAHPGWGRAAVTFVPATASAVRRRGFDHAELLATHVARELHLACLPLLQRPRASDQRGLGRQGRFANMAGTATVLPGATMPNAVIVVDDVMTTGATLFAAATALKAAGAERVYALTFARAW